MLSLCVSLTLFVCAVTVCECAAYVPVCKFARLLLPLRHFVSLSFCRFVALPLCSLHWILPCNKIKLFKSCASIALAAAAATSMQQPRPHFHCAHAHVRSFSDLLLGCSFLFCCPPESMLRFLFAFPTINQRQLQQQLQSTRLLLQLQLLLLLLLLLYYTVVAAAALLLPSVLCLIINTFLLYFLLSLYFSRAIFIVIN